MILVQQLTDIIRMQSATFSSKLIKSHITEMPGSTNNICE